MNAQQQFALVKPCRSLGDFRTIHHVLRNGWYASLTLDVVIGEDCSVVFDGEPSWIATGAVHVVGQGTVTLETWTPEQCEAVDEILLDALDGVGDEDSDTWDESEYLVMLHRRCLLSESQVIRGVESK